MTEAVFDSLIRYHSVSDPDPDRSRLFPTPTRIASPITFLSFSFFFPFGTFPTSAAPAPLLYGFFFPYHKKTPPRPSHPLVGFSNNC